MKIKELRDLSVPELETKLAELKKELFDLRFKQVTKQLDNPMKIVVAKKSIARVKTLLREEELKAEA